MKSVVIYTDGACSCNPGPGGWSAILIYNGIKKEISGGESVTTNNIMELTAVIKGLSALKESCNVEVYSDSAYVVNSISEGWLENWQNNNWKTADKKPVKNLELWQEYLKVASKHTIKFCKVKGHADDELNNRCDYLARMESQKF